MRYKIAVGVPRDWNVSSPLLTPNPTSRHQIQQHFVVDLEYAAKLSDLGIAKMAEPAASHHLLSSVAGSLAYIPPEYSFGMRVTEKIDIYSFSVALLELVTGKRAPNPLESVDGENLVQWVHNRVMTPEELCEVLDSKCGTSSESEMVQVLKIAVVCTNYVHRRARRPTMREVLKLLRDVAPKLSIEEDTNNDEGSEEGLHAFDLLV